MHRFGKKSRFVAALVVLVVAAGAAALWLRPPSVRTVAVQRSELTETLVTTGRVRSASRAAVGVPLVGTVEQVLVREGARVAAGELLLTLEDAEQRAAAAEARAGLGVAEAQLDRIRDVDHPTAAAALESAELEAQQLERDVRRAQILVDSGAAAPTALEEAQRAAEAARARYAAALARARSAGAGGADRRAAQAAVGRARESLATALARLERTRIRAPAAGRVLTRNVEPGDAVQPGRVLIEIALDGPAELRAFPDERMLGRLRVGQQATASADAYPGKSFRAAVTWIAPVVDPRQGTIEVRLAVPEPPPYLLPDMTVSVNIELGRKVAAATLPAGAVRAPLTDTAWVWTVEEGRACRVPVKTGMRSERLIEIVAGLDEGARVIAEGGDAIGPGDRVRIRNPR